MSSIFIWKNEESGEPILTENEALLLINGKSNNKFYIFNFYPALISNDGNIVPLFLHSLFWSNGYYIFPIQIEIEVNRIFKPRNQNIKNIILGIIMYLNYRINDFRKEKNDDLMIDFDNRSVSENDLHEAILNRNRIKSIKFNIEDGQSIIIKNFFILLEIMETLKSNFYLISESEIPALKNQSEAKFKSSIAAQIFNWITHPNPILHKTVKDQVYEIIAAFYEIAGFPTTEEQVEKWIFPKRKNTK